MDNCRWNGEKQDQDAGISDVFHNHNMEYFEWSVKKMKYVYAFLLMFMLANPAMAAYTPPAGSTGTVQFNNGGRFGGSSGLTYASSTGTLTATILTGLVAGTGTGSASLADSVNQPGLFSGGVSPTAGNLYGIAVIKSGTEEGFFGINKNTTTGSVPANALYLSTYTGTGTISIGRGNTAGLPNTADILIGSTGNVTVAQGLTVTGHTTFEGVTSTGATGTGALVYGTSPTFTTPTLGIPASGTATNLTGLPSAAITSLSGSDKSIQLKDHGILYGSAGLLYNSSTGALTDTNSFGNVSTDGLLLTNTGTAASGYQRWSPRLHLHGSGWKTNATVASEPVDVIAELQPVQGAADPSFNYVVSGSINNGSYASFVNIANTANGNTVLGYLTPTAETGTTNTIIGNNAGHTMTSNSENTIIGQDAGASISSGDQNVIIGGLAVSRATVNTSTVIGTEANLNNNATNNLILGYNASGKVTSNTTQLGSSAMTSLYLGNMMLVGSTKFTLSGCSAGTTIGGALFGSYVSGTSGSCSVTITFNGGVGHTAPNGHICVANDTTTVGDAVVQTGDSTTTATLAGTTVSGDVIKFVCEEY